MRKRTSIVWSISRDELVELVKNSDSVYKILLHFGLKSKGHNYRTLRKRLDEENIDYSHIKRGLDANKGKNFNHKEKIPLSEILVENSTYNRGNLKQRLLELNMIEHKCKICGQTSQWNNQNLVMVLDHINGISNDNRLENLRMLCPNCNSQQSTFAGRNNKKTFNPNSICQCGEYKYKSAKVCHKCSNINRKRKFEISKEKLELLINKLPMTTIAKQFNVSDNAIRRRAKLLGIQL